MLEIAGNYGSAKIFTDVVDEASVEQVRTLLDQEFIQDSQIRMMPDIHAGAGCTIGTTMTITDKIVPNLVGVDIGCGMLTVKLKETEIDFAKLDEIIRKYVPYGFAIRSGSDRHPYHNNIRWDELICNEQVSIKRAKNSVGSLGSGNHFIEVDRGEDGALYLVIHTGSRHFGLEIAKHYQEMACRSQDKVPLNDIKNLIENMRARGQEEHIQQALEELREKNVPKIPKDLCFVESHHMEDYLHDLKIAQEFAMWNRIAIADTILDRMGLNADDMFTTIHNYIDLDEMILRKGAVSAKKDEILLIPINMRDGSLICKGKGNPDWNYSAPHGAGRLMSRKEAFKNLSMDQFKHEMEGIYTTSVAQDTLDESPMAYKTMDDIVSNIGDTAEILQVIKPVYNFKAGGKE